MAQTRHTYQGGDPGPAGAGAVPVHPAPGAPGPGSGASSREWGRGSDHAGESGKKEKCTNRKRQQNFLKCGGSENSGKT